MPGSKNSKQKNNQSQNQRKQAEAQRKQAEAQRQKEEKEAQKKRDLQIKEAAKKAKQEKDQKEGDSRNPLTKFVSSLIGFPGGSPTGSRASSVTDVQSISDARPGRPAPLSSAPKSEANLVFGTETSIKGSVKKPDTEDSDSDVSDGGEIAGTAGSFGLPSRAGSVSPDDLDFGDGTINFGSDPGPSQRPTEIEELVAPGPGTTVSAWRALSIDNRLEIWAGSPRLLRQIAADLESANWSTEAAAEEKYKSLAPAEQASVRGLRDLHKAIRATDPDLDIDTTSDTDSQSDSKTLTEPVHELEYQSFEPSVRTQPISAQLSGSNSGLSLDGDTSSVVSVKPAKSADWADSSLDFGESELKRAEPVKAKPAPVPETPVFVPEKPGKVPEKTPKGPSPPPKMASHEERARETAIEQAKARIHTAVIEFKDLSEIVSINISEFAYKGFSPSELLHYMAGKAIDNGRNLSEDLAWLAALFLHRGSNLDKILKKSGPETISKLSTLKVAYEIASKGKNTSKPTIARVAIIMAPCAVMYLHNNKDAKTILTETVKGLPRGFLTNLYGSLIPEKGNFRDPKDFELVVKLHLYLMVIFSRTIMPLSKAEVKKPPCMAECYKYFIIQHTSDYVGQVTRIELFRSIQMGGYGIDDHKHMNGLLLNKVVKTFYKSVIQKHPKVDEFDLDSVHSKTDFGEIE